jgi:hypothetical protein
MATEAVPRCGRCNVQKRTFGTGVYLCPDCDFGRCSNKGCGRTVKLLAWSRCPHCGTRQ